MKDIKIKPAKKRENTISVGFELDVEILPLLEKRVEEAGITKRDYIQRLIMKDLGLRYVPAQWVPIERDEESV